MQPIEDGLSAVVAVFDVDTGTRLRDMEGFCGKDWFGVPDASCNEYPELPYPELAGLLHFSPDDGVPEAAFTDDDRRLLVTGWRSPLQIRDDRPF